MPTYEYRCKKCGDEFEIFQLITENPLSTCMKCGGEVERLIGAGAGLIFKGSGFYQTDYRSESYRKAEKAEKSSSKTSSASAGASDKKTSSGDTKTASAGPKS